jgi:NDP-hexose-3-ketoreductase
MKKSSRIHIGVLGCASIATRSVIPAIMSLNEQYDLVGIASRNIIKAKSLSSEIGCDAFDDYEALLESSKVDTVYIPLPNSLHFKYVQLALENGKHVLVEKSLACTFHEAETLVKTAMENELVLLENFQFRFHSQLKKIVQFVENGVIGDLRLMRVSFGFPPFSSKENIRYSSKLGGGALLDAGAYALKIAPFFLGNEIHVVQASSEVSKYHGVDLWGSGVIKQKNGSLTCQFGFGFDNYYQCTLDLWGTLGKLRTERIFTAPAGYSPKLFIENQDSHREIMLPADNHFENMLVYFHDLIKGHSPKEIEYLANLKQAKLVEEFKRLAVSQTR